MINFMDRLGNAVDYACMGCVNTGVKIKKGLMAVGEETSRAMYEVYSIEGLEKASKAAIANMRAASLVPCMRGVFDSCIKTMEFQKDLIYGTLVFSSTADFIKTNPDGTYSFDLPREANKTDIAWVKLLYGIGNFFETGYFLQKYKIYSFTRFSQLAEQIGSTRLFSSQYTVNDVPYLNCWANKPKDFFVTLASGYNVYNCLKADKFLTPENCVKLVGNVGKIILIGFADKLVRRNHLIALAVIDVATQNASFIGIIFKRKKERNARFNDPTRF